MYILILLKARKQFKLVNIQYANGMQKWLWSNGELDTLDKNENIIDKQYIPLKQLDETIKYMNKIKICDIYIE